MLRAHRHDERLRREWTERVDLRLAVFFLHGQKGQRGWIRPCACVCARYAVEDARAGRRE